MCHVLQSKWMSIFPMALLLPTFIHGPIARKWPYLFHLAGTIFAALMYILLKIAPTTGASCMTAIGRKRTLRN